MTTALHVMVGLVIAAMVVPLLLLLLYALADALNLSFASRILDVAYRALMFEFAIGTIVNVVGGLAIVGLGIWGGFAAPRLLYQMLALVIVPYGAWRVWRGVAIWLPAAAKSQPPDSASGRSRSR